MSLLALPLNQVIFDKTERDFVPSFTPSLLNLRADGLFLTR
jgi:hypothetical protein